MKNISTLFKQQWVVKILLLTVNLPAVAQDSSGVRQLGHLWDICADRIEVSGDFAYIADWRGRLFLMDISNPANPRETGSCGLLGYRHRVKPLGDYVYVASRLFGLHIITNDSIHPTEVASIATPGTTEGIAVAGNTAYIADGSCGVRVINVSNRASPVEIGVYDTALDSHHVTIVDVALSGNYLIALEQVTTHALRIVNVSNPALPVEVGSCQLSAEPIQLKVAGQFAYVACIDSTLRIVNIANPQSPVEIGSIRLTQPIHDFSVSGNNVYAVFSGIGDYNFCIVSVSNPTAPSLIYSIQGLYTPSSVFTREPYTYLAENYNGVAVFNVSNPLTPTLVGNATSSAGSISCSVSGNIAAVVNYGHGIQFVNVSNPTNPRHIKLFTPAIYAHDVVINGDFAYIADGDSGLRVLSISNPLLPVEVGRYDVMADNAYAIKIRGNTLYLVDAFSYLRVLDFSTPSTPQLISATGITGGARDIAISGYFAYIVSESMGLTIVNVANPVFPRYAGHFDTPGTSSRVAASGNFVYVADGDFGLRVINVSNPSSPTEVAHTFLPGSARDVEVQGNYVFVVDNEYGVWIFNVSNPALPTEVGYYLLSNPWRLSVEGVTINGDRLYLSALHEFGIYDFSQAVGVVDRVGNEIPQEFSLSPNFPNPFNATTTIKYSVAKSAKIELAVFDITGREVGKIVDFHQNPGEYSVKFDGTTLSTGTYFIRLRAGEFVQTRKMVLLK